MSTPWVSVYRLGKPRSLEVRGLQQRARGLWVVGSMSEDEESLELYLGLGMNEYGRKNIHAVAVRAFAVSSSTPRAFGSGEPIAQLDQGLERDGSFH